MRYPSHPQSVPLDRVSEICCLYRSGLSINRVSEHTGFGAGAVRACLLCAGVTLRSTPEGIRLHRSQMNEADKQAHRNATIAGCSKRLLDLPGEEIAARYIAGESVNALAKAYGTNRNVINVRLVRAGVSIRGRSEAETLKWQQMSDEQRSKQVAAAHEASRGIRLTEAQKRKQAKTRQQIQFNATALCKMMAQQVRALGLPTTIKEACGPYNIGLAIDGTVAVKVCGSGWYLYGQHAKSEPKRVEYLLGQGWHYLTVWIDKGHPLMDRAAEYACALAHHTRRHKSVRREYRVIWGDGDSCPERRVKLDGVPAV